MRSWISKKWSGEWGVYLRFMSSLLLIVGGVFAYFTITGCGEPSPGCGVEGSYFVASSDFTAGRSVSSSPYNLSLSGTGGTALENDPVSLISAVLPGSEVTRYISYTAETGKDPTQIQWTPPQGSSNFNFFSTPPANPGEPAPFIFDNDPPLPLPLHITYNAPSLPTNTSTLVVGEILMGIRVSETDDIHVLNYTISATASRSQAAPAPVPSTGPLALEAVLAAPISALEVQRWYGAPGITLTTELCQQLYDWLQSDKTFTAMRMPVTTTGISNLSYELPVLFPVDSNPSPNVITARPKIDIRANGIPITGIPDLPLEVRSDRIAFMENHLPSATGEHWVALGVAREPKITCPAGMTKTYWEFSFAFSVHPDSPIDALPLYYCQDGQDAPPIGSLALNLLASQKDGIAVPSSQSEGITCLGPQEHILNTNPVIHVGNPNTVWNVFPQDEIRLKHYVQVIGLAPTIRFVINSDTAGFGWRLYEGEKGGNHDPILSKEVDLTKPYTAISTTMFFWMIGAVPTGTIPGSHNFTLRVEKSDDPSKYGSSTDMVWVGEWVPPPTPGGAKHYIYLPLVMRQ